MSHALLDVSRNVCRRTVHAHKLQGMLGIANSRCINQDSTSPNASCVKQRESVMACLPSAPAQFLLHFLSRFPTCASTSVCVHVSGCLLACRILEEGPALAPTEMCSVEILCGPLFRKYAQTWTGTTYIQTHTSMPTHRRRDADTKTHRSRTSMAPNSKGSKSTSSSPNGESSVDEPTLSCPRLPKGCRNLSTKPPALLTRPSTVRLRPLPP